MPGLLAAEPVDLAVAAGLVRLHQDWPTLARSGFAHRAWAGAVRRLAAAYLEELKLLAPRLQAVDRLDGSTHADEPIDAEPSPSSPDRRSTSILRRRLSWDG